MESGAGGGGGGYIPAGGTSGGAGWWYCDCSLSNRKYYSRCKKQLVVLSVSIMERQFILLQTLAFSMTLDLMTTVMCKSSVVVDLVVVVPSLAWVVLVVQVAFYRNDGLSIGPGPNGQLLLLVAVLVQGRPAPGVGGSPSWNSVCF